MLGKKDSNIGSLDFINYKAERRKQVRTSSTTREREGKK